ncbi:carbon-monoxide dehydrogenase small subunit [Nitrobacteraceae bacterium AZCC 2161]
MIRQLQLTVNGKAVTQSVEPRTHLADVLREKLRLTGTHLRCEQGVCGACTVLIDEQPARSCITYAALCDSASVVTIEGLENDPVIVRLRRAFSLEHGLQCGFCTPGMLVTARDIVMRVPDADEARIRVELSGNLCRCTGYAGIVHAVQRVLAEKLDTAPNDVERDLPLAPVGARLARETIAMEAAVAKPLSPLLRDALTAATTSDGLGSKQPNIRITQSFTVDRPRDEVWRFFADVEGVAACLPGARLRGPPVDNRVQGQFTVKLGPITASFSGAARIERNEDDFRGMILGSGRDTGAGSRATGEIEYRLLALQAGAATKVDIEIRALIAGPLAQFGRGGIMDDLTKRIVDVFAANIEARLSGRAGHIANDAPLHAGTLLKDLMKARLVTLMGPVLRMFRPRD